MDDVISRKWLMECVEEGWIKFETEKDENKFIHLVRDIAPSAQPEQDWSYDDDTKEITLIIPKDVYDSAKTIFLSVGYEGQLGLRGMIYSAQPEDRCSECDAWNKYKNYTPEQRWIPTSKKLPEPRIDVWCNSDMGQMVGYYEEHVKTWYGRDDLELMVTAWKPLPEPYKGENNE